MDLHFKLIRFSVKKVGVSLLALEYQLTVTIRRTEPRWSPIQELSHQLLLKFKYRLANYFSTKLPVHGLKNVAEHQLITRFPEAVTVQARYKVLLG